MHLRLDPHWVLERTEEGNTEIAQRTRKLPLPIRAVLIMVDGRSELHQLERKMVGMTDPLGTIQSLMADGLIRRRAHSADADVQNAQITLRESQSLTNRTINEQKPPVAPPAPPAQPGLVLALQALARAQATSLTERLAKPTASPSAKVPTELPTQAPTVPPTPVATTEPIQAVAAVKGRRRSLALSRMYLLDQIERMFGPQSDAVRNLLRAATTREALLEAYADCKEILLETSGPERVERVEQEFMGMLPEANTNGQSSLSN